MISDATEKHYGQTKLHPILLTYVTYKQLFPNTAPSLNHLKSELSKFDILATVSILSKLNLLMTDKDYALNDNFQMSLIKNFLNPYTVNKYDNLRGTTEKGNLIFHRHQLLLLLKYAFTHCTQNPNTNFEICDVRYKFGTCCLLANNFLYLTKICEEALNTSNDDFKKEVLWKELLPSYELYIPAELTHSIARARRIFNSILPKMPKNQHFMELDAYFQDFTKLSIDNYMYLIFAILALYISRRTELRKEVNAIFIELSNFTTNTKVSPENVSNLLNLISIPIEQYGVEISKSKDKELNYGFLVFKKYPLAKLINNKYICLDFNFLVDKITNGIFWTLNDNLNYRDRCNFHAFWGKLFETYIKTYIEYSLSQNRDIFIANPMYDNEEGEVADAIFDYDEDLVLLEYKFTILTEDAKYTESIANLIEQVKSKFEKNQENEWKGYGQLANSINKLFSNRSNKTCKFINKDKIKRIFPVLITYEHFLNSPLTNYFFNKFFRCLIDFASLPKDLEIKPLVLISIEDFEACQPFLKNMNKTILERLEYDSSLYCSFADFLKNKYRNDPSLASDWIDTEYLRYFEEIKISIFG